MTKRRESDEDGVKHVEKGGERGETEAQRGRVTLEGILCQQAPVNQCNCVLVPEAMKIGRRDGEYEKKEHERESEEMEKGREGSWHQK